MNERFEVWHSDIDIITKEFEKLSNSLSNDQLNWKPNPKAWSIGQIIEHLVKTSEEYFTVPDLINNKNYKPSFLTKFKFLPTMFGKLILKAVDPNTKRKSKTMIVFEPAQSHVEKNILNYFALSQDKLHKFINDNRELIINKTIIPSPLNKHIIYHFDTVIDILVNHQKRHYNQAKSVLKMQNLGSKNG